MNALNGITACAVNRHPSTRSWLKLILKADQALCIIWFGLNKQNGLPVIVINCTPLRRYASRVFFIVLLLLVGCVQPQITPSIVPTASPASPTPSATGTATNSLTPTSSPTITETPAPTWTPWLIQMNWATGLPLVIDPKNPAWDCIISYFDLTIAPGELDVWRRDNGGYLFCTHQ